LEIKLETGIIGLLLAMLGYLINRWIAGNDRKFEALFKKVDDIEEKFNENFRYTMGYRTKLADDIKGMLVQMTVANGRTAKLETEVELVAANLTTEIGKVKGKIDTQIEVCKERNNHHG
jgi:hypothetical protein